MSSWLATQREWRPLRFCPHIIQKLFKNMQPQSRIATMSSNQTNPFAFIPHAPLNSNRPEIQWDFLKSKWKSLILTKVWRVAFESLLLASFFEESSANWREIWDYVLASSMAPEVILDQMWDQSADIWSLGVLVFTIKDDMLMEIAELFMTPFTLCICR